MENYLTTHADGISQIGAEIGLDLGNAMIQSYRSKHPNSQTSYEVGRNILEKILAQPGCKGIRLYDALNETGHKTLVYVGIDSNGKTLTSRTVVDESGKIVNTKGIVADRVRLPGTKPWGGIADDDGGWNWSID